MLAGRTMVLMSTLLGLVLAASIAPAGEPPAGGLDPEAEKACTEFARKLEVELNAGEHTEFDKGFDKEAYLNRIMKGIPVSPKASAGLRAGARNGIDVLGKELATACQSGGCKLLRIRVVDGQPRAVFRVFAGDGGGLNYHEYLLVLTAKGEVRFNDIFPYASGETMSATTRRIFLQFAAKDQQGLLDKLMGNESQLVKNWPRLMEMLEHIKAGRYEKALQVYAGLPAELKRDKWIMLLRLRAANGMGFESKEYAAVLDDLLRFFPNEGWIDLVGIDAYCNRKQYDKALAAVDRLDKAIGGDAYLDVLRANVLVLQDKLDEAAKRCQTAVELEPDLMIAHWSLIGINLKRKDYQAVAAGLGVLEKDHGIEIGDLSAVPDYADFVKSEEGKAWQAAHPVEPAPAEPVEE